jgi:hypothetical protein
MPTLGTQNISTSYPQLLKTFGTGGLDGTLQIVTDGDNTSSALSVSTSGVASTGTFEVVGTSLLTGAVTFGTSFTASTGTATIGAAVIGATTFTTGFTSSTGTNTLGTASIGTASIGTASIGTATIGTVSGATIFTTGFTSSTGTNTLGTIASTTFTSTGLATVGTLKVGASGPSLTAVTFATAAYAGATVLDIDHATTGSNVSTGTLAASGVVLGDMVIGNINSIGSTTGATPAGLLQDFRIESAGVLRFTIFNSTQTTGTIPAGTIFATALRFTA